MSAWSIPDSPCGPSCSFQDIGMSTTSVRQDMAVRSHASDTFGKYIMSWTDNNSPSSFWRPHLPSCLTSI